MGVEVRRVKVEHVGEVVVLTPETGFLAHGGEVVFEQTYRPLLSSVRRFVVDLGDIEELDSKRLAAIVVFFKRARAAQCAVIFCNVGRMVKEILRVTRLDRIFSLVDLRDDAVQFAATVVLDSF
jgi:anti-anti-sigma factor